MIDMSKTIIAKSDQLNSDDLIGRTLTIRVTKVSLVAGDQPVAISFEGDDGKPWKPCKSMRRILVGAWGGDGAVWVGRQITLYRDQSVKFGGAEVGGIRISHMSHIDRPMTLSLTATRKLKQPYTVEPLAMNQQTRISAAPDRLRAAKSVDELGNVWKSLTKQEQAEHLKVKDDRKAELTATPSTGEQLPDLDTLLVQLEASELMPKFFELNNATYDDLENSRGPKRLEWSLKVSDYLKQHGN